MNNNLRSYYIDNAQYLPRLETDAYFMYGAAKAEYSGISDSMAHLIEKIQLKDTELWKLFVRQFRSNPDDADAGWRCEYWGKMMRGACLTYLYTKDSELYSILTETVRDLLSAQDGMGRITTYSTEAEFDGWDLWGRKYVLLGMLHFHEICTDESLRGAIIEACKRHADYIIEHIGNGDGKKNIVDASRHWGGINSSSILEPYVRLYNATGEERYLDFAEYIIENGGSKNGNIFDFALAGEKFPFEYPDYKAYELMSCFEGLIEYFRVTKEEKWLRAAHNFALMLRDSDITVIGCAGCTHELLDNSAVRQTYTKYDGIMQETCVTVTWMKLCSQMLMLTGESVYADEIEKAAFNALYGAVNTEGCTTNLGLPFDSYSPLRAHIRGRLTGGLKYMEDNTAYYGCCACIGAAGIALVPLTNVLLSNTGFAINYYIPGRCEIPTPAGVTCVVETESDYPADGDVSVRLGLIAPEYFTVTLRIPAFSGKTSVRVNGHELETVSRGEFIHIGRVWHDGDMIDITFDMAVQLHCGTYIDDDPDSEKHIAVTRGPIVLARDARVSDDVGGAVSLKLDSDGRPILHRAEKPGFAVQCAWEAETADGGVIKLIDYASAGKTWDEKSLTECWMIGE